MDALTILDEVRVATPCHENWDEMPGDDRVRSCSTCARSVYNISEMTSAEAISLIANREGRLCVRLFRRADGTLITSDCPKVAALPRFWRVHAAAIVLVALLYVWAGNTRDEPPPSGGAVTWDDWVQWASVSLGLRPKPPVTPVFAPPTITVGDMY